MADYEYKPVTAQDVADEGSLDRENAEKAEKAKVSDVSRIDYVEALKNYESRSDVETLAQRRARENGTSFEQTDKAAKETEKNAPIVTDGLRGLNASDDPAKVAAGEAAAADAAKAAEAKAAEAPAAK